MAELVDRGERGWGAHEIYDCHDTCIVTNHGGTDIYIHSFLPFAVADNSHHTYCSCVDKSGFNDSYTYHSGV